MLAGLLLSFLLESLLAGISFLPLFLFSLFSLSLNNKRSQCDSQSKQRHTNVDRSDDLSVLVPVLALQACVSAVLGCELGC